MEESTNVNEFENPGPNGDSSQMFWNFALGLDLKLRFVAVTELDTSAFVQSYRNKYMARKMEGI
jgi:hypothetical protein